MYEHSRLPSLPSLCTLMHYWCGQNTAYALNVMNVCLWHLDSSAGRLQVQYKHMQTLSRHNMNEEKHR